MTNADSPKTQKQSNELILYRLDELAGSVKEITKKLDDQNNKIDNLSAQYVQRTEYEAFKKTVKVNYAGIAVIVSLIVTIVYHIVHIP